MTATSPTPQASYLMWFRRDLRLKDNTAFSELTEIAKQASSKPDIKALFVATPEQWLEQAMSLVQMDFIFRNLKKLAESLFNQLNIELHVLQTSDYHQCIDAIDSFCQQQNISHIASNYEYEVNELARDAALEEQLNQKGIVFNRYGDIFATQNGANSTSYYCDQYWGANLPSTTELLAWLFGGGANNGFICGLACASSNHVPGSRRRHIGSRLCFIP